MNWYKASIITGLFNNKDHCAISDRLQRSIPYMLYHRHFATLTQWVCYSDIVIFPLTQPQMVKQQKKIVVQLHWLYSDLEDSTSCPFNVIIILVPNTFLCSYKGLFTFHKALENSQWNPRRSLIYKKKFFSNLKAKIFFSFFWRKVLTFSLPIFNFFNFSLKISRLNVDWTENLFDACHLNHWPLKLGGNT